ncbi:MAG: magnetochrome domain-containing protein [Candidatus Omnitrophica bacterium]|nr:magnetochrome domain-containing protein [Candidatus Omnitrophota bacterium]
MIKNMKAKTSKIPTITVEDFKARVKDMDMNTYFIFASIILVLLIGVYAIFSPDIKSKNQGNPACGKIVVAADNSTFNSNVAPSLQQAKFFLVINPLTKKLEEAIPNLYYGTVPNPQIAYLVAGKGEEAVIVGNIDPQSYNILMQFGIRVFGGYTGSTKKVINLYRQARIGQASLPINPGQMQANSMPVAQAGFAGQGQGGGCMFYCPNCKFQQAGNNNSNICPICPNCRLRMQQQIPGQGVAFGIQDMNPIGQVYPTAGQLMPDAMNAGWGMQNMNVMRPVCPLPRQGWMQGAMVQGMNLPDPDTMNKLNPGTQVAFGWGEQPFVCPSCNWRLKAANTGNGYPNCPNCGSQMAKDMANNGWPQLPELAANQMPNQMQNQMQANPTVNQPNFWQGQESLGYFLCPNCNWRMYSQNGANEFPRCPNCKQIMARGGAYYPNQYNAQQNFNNQGFAPVAQAAQQVQVTAPPISPNAAMTHEYRGVCSNCHQIMGNTTQQQAPSSVKVGIGKKPR